MFTIYSIFSIFYRSVFFLLYCPSIFPSSFCPCHACLHVIYLSIFYLQSEYILYQSSYVCPSSITFHLSIFCLPVICLFICPSSIWPSYVLYVPLFFPFYNLSVCLYCMPVFYEILPSCLLCIPIYIYYLTDGVTGCSTRTVCSEHHFKAHYKRFCVCVEFADTELSNFQYRIQVFCFLHSNPHCPCHWLRGYHDYKR